MKICRYNDVMTKSIKAYSYDELITIMKELGHPKFRADQLVQWLYARGVSDYQDMTDLPKAFREELARSFPLDPVHVVDRQISNDGARKYLLQYADGALVETVAIPSRTPSNSPEKTLTSDDDGDRLTVCVSTQVGCAMECSFCATGKEGFSRNLLPGEILDQVHVVRQDMGQRVSNVVTMGQGEPFLNYDNTLAALRYINHPKALGIGARHITISTCGILSGIARLSHEPEQFTLAVSLHSADQAVRDALMPRVANETLPQLKKALLEYVAYTNRRVSLEYLMIKGLNDTPQALTSLKSFCSDLLCHVNLLTINPIDETGFLPSSTSVVKSWLNQLEQAHIPVSLRNSRGSDIAGACGQLKNSH